MKSEIFFSILPLQINIPPQKSSQKYLSTNQTQNTFFLITSNYFLPFIHYSKYSQLEYNDNLVEPQQNCGEICGIFSFWLWLMFLLFLLSCEAANIENIVLSLKIPIKLVINNLRCEESLMYLQREVDKEMRERENANLHFAWRESISLHLVPIEVARLASHTEK